MRTEREAFRDGVEAALSALRTAKDMVLEEDEYFGSDGLTETLISAAVDILEEEGLYEA